MILRGKKKRLVDKKLSVKTHQFPKENNDYIRTWLLNRAFRTKQLAESKDNLNQINRQAEWSRDDRPRPWDFKGSNQQEPPS